MHTEPRMTVRRALLMVFVLVGWLHSGAARADSGTDRKPFEAVIVELKAVDDEKVAAWKKEGLFKAVHEQPALAEVSAVLCQPRSIGSLRAQPPPAIPLRRKGKSDG